MPGDRHAVAFGSPNPPINQTLGYNDRNELMTSTRSDNPTLARTYTYDPIGNRLTMVENAPPETTTYERNSLNEYPRATTERGANDLGQGYRYDADGNLVEAYVAPDMNCDGVLNNFDIDAFVLALTNLPGYYLQYPNCNHLNGDMNGDGVLNNFDLDLFVAYLVGHAGATGPRLNFGWDAENRLTLVEPLAPQDGDKKVAFAYDYLGRRVQKQVYNWNGIAWVVDNAAERRYLWAGWLMLMELNNAKEPVRKYTWGLDLAGQSGGVGILPASLESAGGIGGLLAVEDVPLAASYVYTYDGNGNVGQVLDLAAGSAQAALKAKYEYDPYGNVTNETGSYATTNPFRFSTKYWDDETGLGYWGYRYYSPRLGRWLSRDPIEEEGGWLLYAYANNDPTSSIDSLGLDIPGPVSPYSPGWFEQCVKLLQPACEKHCCCDQCSPDRCRANARSLCAAYVAKFSEYTRKDPKFKQCVDLAQIIADLQLSNACFKVIPASNPELTHAFAAVFHVCNKTTNSDANLDPWRRLCAFGEPLPPYKPECKPGGPCNPWQPWPPRE